MHCRVVAAGQARCREDRAARQDEKLGKAYLNESGEVEYLSSMPTRLAIESRRVGDRAEGG